MSTHLDRARELRAPIEPHYSCSQSVLTPFAEELGMPTEHALGVARAFRGGICRGSVCGVLTGALMALGLAGVTDSSVFADATDCMRRRHDGMTDCADLLRANAETGGEKKPFCDALVFDAVRDVEDKQVVRRQLALPHSALNRTKLAPEMSTWA